MPQIQKTRPKQGRLERKIECSKSQRTPFVSRFQALWNPFPPLGHTSAPPSPLRSHQIPDAHQIISGRRQGKHPPHQLPPSVPDLAHQRHRLQPAENFFHPLAFALTHRIAGVTGGARVDGAGTALGVLSDVRGDLLAAQLLHEVVHVEVLVATQGHPLLFLPLLHHGQRRLALCRPCRQRHFAVDYQAVAVLGHHVAQIGQLGFFTLGLLVQARVRIRGRLMRFILEFLTVEVYLGIAGVARRGGGRGRRRGGRRGGVLLLLLKLLIPAQASIKVASTVKCSSESRSCSRASWATCWKKASATSCFNKRSRFLAYTVASHTGSSRFKPTNHRKSML